VSLSIDIRQELATLLVLAERHNSFGYRLRTPRPTFADPLLIAHWCAFRNYHLILTIMKQPSHVSMGQVLSTSGDNLSAWQACSCCSVRSKLRPYRMTFEQSS